MRVENAYAIVVAAATVAAARISDDEGLDMKLGNGLPRASSFLASEEEEMKWKLPVTCHCRTITLVQER